jgi:spoIIIJ-associated protein
VGPAVSEGAAPAAPPSTDVLVRARQALAAILRLGGLQLQHEVLFEDGVVQVNLSGPERELLLNDEAELLQAIEYLLKRALVRAEGEDLQCRVDTEGFREEREEELRRLALESAATVRSSRQAVRLEAMSPAERRIIHLTLAEQPGVRTESEGEGYFKRVTVQPA